MKPESPTLSFMFVGKISYSRMYHYINCWFPNIWSIASQILNQDRKSKYKVLRTKQVRVGHKTRLKKLCTSVNKILVTHKTSFESEYREQQLLQNQMKECQISFLMRVPKLRKQNSLKHLRLFSKKKFLRFIIFFNVVRGAEKTRWFPVIAEPLPVLHERKKLEFSYQNYH